MLIIAPKSEIFFAINLSIASQMIIKQNANYFANCFHYLLQVRADHVENRRINLFIPHKHKRIRFLCQT